MSETESTAAATTIDRELRVASAAEQWADQIADLGGRDTLLFFRDLKVGTLDLAAADPDPRKLLLEGEPVPVSRLFPHEPLRTSAIRSTRALAAKVRELAEDHGLHTAYLAIGVATWADARGQRRPGAPVLLREVVLTPRDAAESDFVVQAVPQPVVNPSLLGAMAADLGIRLRPDDLLDAAGELRYVHVVERLREFAPPHVADGFAIAHRVVIASFNPAKLPLLEELRRYGRELAGQDIVAALAGDKLAELSLREPMRKSVEVEAELPLVADADGQQAAAVTDVLSGSHLVVHAPPGTGATQTVANMIAALVARGQRVLYVSQRQAARDATLDRLDRVGLGDLVLDIPASTHERARLAATVLERMKRLSDPQQLSLDEIDDPQLARLSAALQEHRDGAHSPREPWEVSVYDAEAAVAATPERSRTEVRLSRTALEGLHGVALDEARAAMREYAELGGLALGGKSPWRGAQVPTREAARAIGDAVHHLLHNALFACRDASTRAAVEVGLPGPQTTAEAEDRVRLLVGIRETEQHLRREVWKAPLDDLLAATGTRAFRRQFPEAPGWWRRRRLRRAARDLLVDSSQRPSRQQLDDLLGRAKEQLEMWRRHARDSGLPRVGEHLPAAELAVNRMREHLGPVQDALPDGHDLPQLPHHELSRRLVELAGDEATLEKLPRLTFLHHRLVEAGLADLIGDLRKRGSSPAAAVAAVDHAWNASLLEMWLGSERTRTFDSEAHDALAADFRTADHKHLVNTAARIRYSHARRVSRLTDDFPDQVAVLTEEAEQSGWHRELSGLSRAASDVLLGIAPCWMTSPLLVSQVLPVERMFDVVILDDANQLSWMLAVPAMGRASRVVVVGDQQQLPPLPLGVAALPDEVTDGLTEGSGATGGNGAFESILDRLATMVPARRLANHYGSRDERLIAFANRWFYNDRLQTLPAAAPAAALATTPDDCIRHVLVAAQPGDGLVDSSTAEVNRVVELAIEHARSRPYESLGVVCFSDKHAERIEHALRVALQRAGDVAEFFAKGREERFFVKHLDQIGRDTRDAVIITLGYGRAADGRVLHRFGPLNHDYGPHRLAAALTRARARLTVVSCFTAEEMVPWRLNSEGAQALRDLLEFAVSHGQVKPLDAVVTRDAVREAVADRVAAEGLTVERMYGLSGLRVALAVRHPRREDRFVLAVETDGPFYAAQPSVRERDRLHGEWLDRLGWRVHRVWGEAWAADADREMQRILRAYEAAVAEADDLDAAVAAAEADSVAGLPAVVEAGQPTRGNADGADLLLPRNPIWGYSLAQLLRVVQARRSAGVRGVDELVAAVADELGFEPGRPRVEAVVRQAVHVALVMGSRARRSTRVAGDAATKTDAAAQTADDAAPNPAVDAPAAAGREEGDGDSAHK